MERSRNEVQVGIVTIFALTVLIVGMMWFKQVSVNRGSVMYQVDFPTVEGLQVGDRIQVRGIRAGQVDDVRIMDDLVRVSLLVDEGIELGEDAVVTLGTKGIVGEVVIEILPGAGPPVQEGHIFRGHTAASIATMTATANDALVELHALTAKVSALVDEITAGGEVTATLARANSAVTRLDDLLAATGGDVAATLRSLRAASEDLQGLMASGAVDRAFDDAGSAAARADSLLGSLASSGRRLDSILTKLDEGGGTAALLLEDPSLYLSADSTMTSLGRLLDEMRRNPKKYFKLNVF